MKILIGNSKVNNVRINPLYVLINPYPTKEAYSGTKILRGGTIIIANEKFLMKDVYLLCLLANGYDVIAPTNTIRRIENAVTIREFFIELKICPLLIAYMKLSQVGLAEKCQ
jgi:hypothetical protein